MTDKRSTIEPDETAARNVTAVGGKPATATFEDGTEEKQIALAFRHRAQQDPEDVAEITLCLTLDAAAALARGILADIARIIEPDDPKVLTPPGFIRDRKSVV